MSMPPNIYPIYIEREWKQNGIRIQPKRNETKTEKYERIFYDFYVTKQIGKRGA